MIFAEPPRTRFDVRFALGPVPARIHPYFWVSTIALALRPELTFGEIGLWLVAVLVSILVHELGHAIAFRRFGCSPRITLHGFGGLASADDDEARSLSSTQRIVVSAAGPLAGFVLGGAVLGVVVRLGKSTQLLAWTLGSGPPIANGSLRLLVFHLLFVNLVWGVINLIPVHPLDGGQIALELWARRDPEHGVERSVWLSFFAAIAAAIAGLAAWGSTFMAILFGYLAYSNGRVLRRRYRASLGSLRVVQWVRRRWRSWRTARRKRAIGLRVVREVRAIEKVERAGSDAEADEVAEDMLRVLRDAGERAQAESKRKTPSRRDEG